MPETYLTYKSTNINKIVTYTLREIRIVRWKIASAEFLREIHVQCENIISV